MEKHKCKLCPRKFINGRALGGHMRSHLTTLPIPSKTHHQLSASIESASSSSSSEEEEQQQNEDEDEEEEEEEEGKGLVYGLRENPKRSFRLADPEFSFTVDPAESVVQDRESETESRKNPTRKQRSKRNRKLLDHDLKKRNKKVKLRNQKPSSGESQTEPEPVSSVSNTSPEEDVAMSLMLLSRDIWMKTEDEILVDQLNVQNKFYCQTCSKAFPTHQALSGHKVSHKKIDAVNILDKQTSKSKNGVHCSVGGAGKVKVHECPFCFKVFCSGQALGGHKRSHFLHSTKSSTTLAASGSKVGNCLIDLNLPAPIEEDEVSVISVIKF